MGECAISDATGDSGVFGLRRGYGSVRLAARQRLQKTQDGEGSLLDHTMIVYGNGMGDGNMHSHDPISVLVAGGALGQIRAAVIFSPRRVRRLRTCSFAGSTWRGLLPTASEKAGKLEV